MVVPRVKRTGTIPVPKAVAGAVLGSLGFSWILILYLFLNQPSGTTTATANQVNSVRGLSQQQQQQQQQDQATIGYPNGAPPVYGILQEIEAPSYRLQDPNYPRKTEIVYALPPSGNIKGIVLLLHGCDHNARKFFAPSDSCPTCIGLSEEMRIARIILEQKSLAVMAVTSHNVPTLCWDNNDFNHIKDAIDFFKDKYPNNGPVLAFGASAGGQFAGLLAVQSIVDAAMVGVQIIGPQATQHWLEMERKPPLYLALMPRDTDKVQLVDAEFQMMNGNGPVVEDTDTCRPRPVDASYLNERVPKLTMLQAQAIVSDLVETGHIDPYSGYLILDPVSSNWKEVLRENCGSRGCLENQSLEVGASPLVKALNRAWAFHDYCSEVTLKALQFFEKELSTPPFLQQV